MINHLFCLPSQPRSQPRSQHIPDSGDAVHRCIMVPWCIPHSTDPWRRHGVRVVVTFLCTPDAEPNWCTRHFLPYTLAYEGRMEAHAREIHWRVDRPTGVILAHRGPRWNKPAGPQPETSSRARTSVRCHQSWPYGVSATCTCV